MNFEYLLLNVEDYVGTIKVNRPEKRNAMNSESWIELRDAVNYFNQLNEVRVIVITGAGDQSFVSGADIEWLRERQPLDIYGSAVQDVLLCVYQSKKPVIAAINGYALGGGCELATVCDFRIASEHAKFGQPEITLGILPAGGGTQQLTKLIGLPRAKELILTGNIIDAQKAYEYGLINEVVPKEKLKDRVREFALNLTKKPPIALMLAKIALNESVTSDLNAGLALEKSLQAILFSTQDKIEGTTAFLEKRDAQFIGK
ncbi:enoyl-CoA hydratase/isomerase family protein [Fictibacillus barbaricus]|uniref:Enoyl-CoA hydratase/isomerase family protein n=1 Tax=Fictibacillus barbaricus TaxID=182136 RepID=A0ABS2ZBN4_9BACL|nr:enoyl-CoA hydratase/isomerase family protein [Fictibacillus barbaricus]MBN3545082.1 enoyl-CoA hydratase/isomerase family protein [Fictibacillus barbaricus]GGB61892.1 crotonase [Fictibacillus barbaricus]